MQFVSSAVLLSYFAAQLFFIKYTLIAFRLIGITRENYTGKLYGLIVTTFATFDREDYTA